MDFETFERMKFRARLSVLGVCLLLLIWISI